jgi:type IVB pilus formation R64 PilN family outer membrane protein
MRQQRINKNRRKWSDMQNKVGIEKVVILIAVTLFSLLGCSITSLPSDVRDSVKQTESGIAEANKSLSHASTVRKDNYIKHSNSGYFGNQAIIKQDADFLPAVFSNQIQIDKQFFGMHGIATGLTDLTRVPTVLDLASTVDASSYNCNNIHITQQDGNLIDLLNIIGARCDLGWSYRDGKIVLSDTETKTWAINNIPGDIQVQNQINNSTGIQAQGGGGVSTVGQGGGGGGGSQSQTTGNQTSTQNIAFNLQNNLWQNLQDGVKSMLSKVGKLNVSPSTSSVTVTDRPSVLLRVDRYLKQQNEIMKRQVQIDVQVLNVDVDAADNYGINWKLALNGANASFSINGQAINTGGTGGSQFVPSPVFVPTNTTQAFTIGATSGDLNGSNLVINALSSITKTSMVTSTAVTTLSNQPVPVQFIDQQSYLASVQNTISGQGGLSQTSLTPGQVTTGFSLNILPVVQSDGKVFLQLSLNISALKKIAQFSTQGASVQLPETIQRNLMQKAVIRSGDTFVVTGFDSDNQAIKNTGVGNAYNWLLGGGISANKIKSRMVVLVTPRVVNI